MMITDWLMVIITAIYVIATIFICRFNWISAKAAKAQTEEMLRQYNEMRRPVILISFEVIRSGLCCFVIENVGESPAHDVSIKINNEFIDCVPGGQEESALKRLTESQLFIASKQKFTVVICSQPEIKNVMGVVAKFTVKYDGYEEKHEIDISQYGYMLVYDSPLEDISQNIKRIREQDNKFYKDILKANPKQKAYTHVMLHEETKDEANKYRIYKMVCLEPRKNAREIAKMISITDEYCLRLLNELMEVDKLVTYTFDSKLPMDDYEYLWIKL